ncbi:major facilitator superfamily domain-containing protein [Rhypophila decipiens]|uniref:Major facilitator superfamily domain-containing protein n=1 Tax=Rhypophila decipiens TaxID=261697 RepID=A0AAN7BCW4_9PEZI|nr:major facilitator superfamily domain-containing protein [Rhypophila decipiens]
MAITQPPQNIAGDDHEEESPLLLRQDESSSEDSFQLEIISPTATKSSLDENDHIDHRTPENNSSAIPDHINHTPDNIKSKRRRLVLISLLVLFMVLLEFGMTFISTPLYQIQEDIICRQLLPPGHNFTAVSSAPVPPMLARLSHRNEKNKTASNPELPTASSPPDDDENNPSSPPPSECKTSPLVQAEFSIINSWSVVLQLLPGLVMAVPMGLLADKHGRTVVMALSMAGMTLGYGFSILVCSVPDFFGGSLRWTWAGSVFNFLGGGMTVFSAMVFSMLADVSGEGERSTAFSYLTAGMHAGAIIAPPATYWLMKVGGDWTSVYVGLSILVLAIIFALCLPETLRSRPSEEEALPPFSSNGAIKPGLGKPKDLLLPKMKTGLRQFRDFLKLFHTNLILLMTSILLTTFGRDAQTVLMQYVTVKFGWSWSEAGLIQSIQSITTLTLLTALLPLASYFLLKYRHILPPIIVRIQGPQSRDLTLARVSILLQTLGAFLTGFSPSAGVLVPSVILSSLGTGFNILVRGLMTTMLLSSSSSSEGPSYTSLSPSNGGPDDDDEPPAQRAERVKGDDIEGKDSHIALLNSSIAWVETAGAMIATPLLAGSFRLGLSWAGIWTGLPFFLAGCLFAFATVVVLFVRVHDHHHHQDEQNGPTLPMGGSADTTENRHATTTGDGYRSVPVVDRHQQV